MVNFVLSFCKITGASRIFSRNFYLPLLKPLTPKDALRTFRITGKWLLGSKIQHYIPVLLNHKQKRSKKIKDFGKIIHKPNDDYTYLIPVFDPENESHQLLQKMLDSKNADGNFVYTVEDKKCNIILSGQFEVAIREGDIIDILVAQRNDKILVKLRDFKKIGIEMDCFETDGVILSMGEGATGPEEEKFHHHGKLTMSIAKIFEDKERQQEEWELELKKLLNRKKKQTGEGTKEWEELLQVTLKSFDLGQFEKDAKRVVDQVSEPIIEYQIGMKVENLENTVKVSEVFDKFNLNILPLMSEIPEIIKCMPNAKLHEISKEINLIVDENDNSTETKLQKIYGVLVKLENEQERFVVGQMVKTEDGDVFVPGQTIETEFGLEYSPGFVINLNGKATLIKGLIVGEENKQKPVFVPTESTITQDGHLSFATTKEERILYKPKKRPFHKEKNIDIQTENQCESTLPQEEEPIIEDKKPVHKIKKTKIKKKVKTKIIDEIKIKEIPPTPVAEIDTEDIMQDFKIDEENTTESLEVTEHTDNEGSFTLDQRQEWEQLLKELMDDGMEEIIASIEDKKASIQQKLEALKQLKISLGDDFVTYVSLEDAQEIASLLTNNRSNIVTISEILVTLTRRVATLRNRNSLNPDNVNNPTMVSPTGMYRSDFDLRFNASNNRIRIALKAAAIAANEAMKMRPKDQIFALSVMKITLLENLINENLIEEICELMGTSLERNEICSSVFRELTQKMQESKVAVLKSVINLCENEENFDVVLEKLEQILERNENLMGTAFSKICKVNPSLLKYLIQKVKAKVDRIKTEDGAIMCVKDAIISTVLDNSHEYLIKFNENANDDEIMKFIEESIGLSKSLGLNEVCEKLKDSVTNSSNIKNVLRISDRNCKALLERLIIIRQLAANDSSLNSSLQRIRRNPECGKTDPRIRRLVRESAVLISEASPLKSSREVPLQFLKSGNLLAIEDFLIQRVQYDGPIFVTKKGFQAIIPKETTSSVLAGRIPYLLVDETGISNFKPKHLISALNLVKNRENRYENYKNVGERARSASPFYSSGISSRGSSPQSVDLRNRKRMSLTNSRMVA